MAHLARVPVYDPHAVRVSHTVSSEPVLSGFEGASVAWKHAIVEKSGIDQNDACGLRGLRKDPRQARANCRASPQAFGVSSIDLYPFLVARVAGAVASEGCRVAPWGANGFLSLVAGPAAA